MMQRSKSALAMYTVAGGLMLAGVGVASATVSDHLGRSAAGLTQPHAPQAQAPQQAQPTPLPLPQPTQPTQPSRPGLPPPAALVVTIQPKDLAPAQRHAIAAPAAPNAAPPRPHGPVPALRAVAVKPTPAPQGPSATVWVIPGSVHISVSGVEVIVRGPKDLRQFPACMTTAGGAADITLPSCEKNASPAKKPAEKACHNPHK